MHALARLVVFLGALHASSPPRDTLPLVNEFLTDSALVAIATHQPDSMRLAISLARASTAHTPPASDRTTSLAFAHRLALSYAIAWQDSFFVREVARFSRESPAWQVRWWLADSLRRSGISAAGQRGVPAAMRLWRRSLAIFFALHDTAGRAAAIGNIGAGFYLAGDLDSAKAYLIRARTVASSIRDVRTEANAVGTLASVHKDLGNLREARTLYEAALALRSRSGDGRGAAADQNNLGLLAQTLGDLPSARRAFVAALRENRSAERNHSVAINLANLANLASITGDSRGADSLYRAALSLHSELRERDDEAVVLHDLALLQMRRADLDGALVSLTRAIALTDSTGADREHVAELADLASLQAARGDVEGGLANLRIADRIAATSHEPAATRTRLALARAELAVALNQLADAEREYRVAERFASASRDRSLLAEAQRGEGTLLTQRQQFTAATALLTSSVRNNQAAGDIRASAASRLLLGYTQGLAGDTARARLSLVTARDALHFVHDPAAEASAWGALGDLELSNQATFAAEADYRRGIAILGQERAPTAAWPLHAGLGSALMQRGALSDARSEFRVAIGLVEQTAVGLRVEEQRAAFHSDKWDLYAMLALAERKSGNAGEAFAVSERMRAQQALALLARGSVSHSSADDSLLVREQELRHRIGELMSLVEIHPPSPATLRGSAAATPSRDAALGALADAEHAYADVVATLREQSSLSGYDVNPPSATWRAVASQLGADDALLEYLITDSSSTVFVVTRDTVAALTIDAHRSELASLVDYTRDAIARPIARGETTWRAPLHRLYQTLMQPVGDAGFLRGRHHLIIVPHAELHFLPFAALLVPGERDRFLIENVTITMAPSASMWLRLTGRPVPPVNGSILAVAPQTTSLPASRAEVDSIGALYGSGATVLFDGRATREALLARARGSDVIHIASLGVLNKQNPLFSFVDLASHGSDDGRLTVTDVYGLHLNARLVVLSACQTALGAGTLADIPAGDDWVGFTSAFLHAGSRDVVATLWPVEDGATAALITEFYRSYRLSGDAAGALAVAQRIALRDRARASPMRWAGFTLTGGR